MGPQAIGACRCVYCCTCGTGEIYRYGCPCRCTERDKARRKTPKLLLPLPKKTWPIPRKPHLGNIG